jgi:glycosyltransferase involved in cell wall biosynthesis
MRIAFDCRAAFQGMGGIGQYAWSLLREYAGMETSNHFVCYFTHLDPPETIPLPPNFTRRVFKAGMIDERFDQLILPSLLKEDRIDLYHNPTFAVPVIRDGATTVATVHDVVFKRHSQLVEPKLRHYLDAATRRACRTADSLITVSEFSKSEIVELYGVDPGRIIVIPNGVRPPVPASESRDRSAVRLTPLGLSTGAYVLYVGSIEPKKNINLLVSAFRMAADRLPGFPLKLALAGSRAGGVYPIERRIAELGIAGRVAVLGYVPADLLEDLYSHALMFVYPSLYEGFGLPPLEAMARGVPTIVSNSSSLPEVVGGDALIVDPAKPESLAEAIIKLAEGPLLREDLARRGLERAKRFSWRRSAEAHLDVYEMAVRSHEHCASGV